MFAEALTLPLLDGAWALFVAGWLAGDDCALLLVG
jgi:hypothetical protein